MENDINEIKQKIAIYVDEGLDPEKNKKEIAERLGITPAKLKELFISERQDRLLKKAEKTSEEMLDLDLNSPDLERKYGKTKIALMKLKLQEAEFIRSTLGKDNGYSSRSEITGKNGEEIRIKEIIFNAPIVAQQK